MCTVADRYMITTSMKTWLLLFLSLGCVLAQSDPFITIISTGYSSELFTFNLDPLSGLLVLKATQPVEENLSWLSYDKPSGNLYAVHEVDNYGDFGDSGAISRWRLDNDNVTFQMQEVKSSVGTIPAHVEVDVERRFLYISNYMGGNFVAYSLNEDLSLGEVVLVDQFGAGSGVNPDRQNTSHVHHSARFRDFVYAVDLGTDLIYRYQVVSGNSVERVGETVCSPGSGPRHMAVVEEEGLAYVINELQMSVVVYEVQEDTGELFFLATIPYLVEGALPGAQSGAEIAVSPNRNHLYISTRGVGAIVVFERVDPEWGYLNQVQMQPTVGSVPRHFAITPEGSCLVATAQQPDGKLETFLVDPVTGMLSPGSVEDSEADPSVIVVL